MKKNFAAQTPPASPSGRTCNPQSAGRKPSCADTSAPARRRASFHPGLLLFFSMLLLLPGAVSLITDAGDRQEGIYETQPAAPFTSYSGQCTELTQLDPILAGDNLIVTYRIDKTELSDVSYSLEAQAVFGDDHPEYDFVNSASIGFETPQIFVSAVLPVGDHDRDAVSEAEIGTAYEETYVNTPEDYSYLTEDGEDFLSAYRSFSPENYSEIRLDTDGRAAQSGIVTFTVTNPSTNYLSGAVNIVYRKDGQPVFGDVYSFYASASSGTKAFAYTPRCELPEYDEVELINMHD